MSGSVHIADSRVEGGAEPTVEKRVIFLLATLLLANPVVIFLLGKSVVMAAGVSLLSVAAIQVSVSQGSRRILTAYLFNVLALISAAAHAEVILLYAFPDHIIENLYTIEKGYYFNRPLLEQNFRGQEFSVTYRTNVQGFRLGTAQEPSHEIGRVDWLVLGDSFTQGAQVEFEDLYSTKLNLRFPDKVVVNAGISGMGIAQEYNYFVDKGRRHKPALVILQLGSFNDFMNIEPRPAGLTDWLMTQSAALRLLLTDLKYRDPGALPLGRWTEPFYPDQESNSTYNVFYKVDSAAKLRDLKLFEKYLTSMKDVVERNGGKLLLTLLPTREQIYPESLNEVLRSFKIEPSAVDMTRPNRFAAELAGALNIQFLDLLPAFQNAQEAAFFQFDEHLTPRGHAVMAEAIGDYIEGRQGRARAALVSQELAGDRYPSPSQDGALTAYQSVRGGSSEIFVATPDFTERRRLTFNSVDESHPMLSKDKSRVLFTEGRAESHRTDVVVMNVDGSKRKVITAGPGEFGAIPAFSRTNLKLTYAGWSEEGASGELSNPRIVVLDLLTGHKQSITLPEHESWRPVFSPDETSLAYISKRGGQFDLYSFDLVTGQERRLTNTTFDEWDPQYTPDGRRLAYAARQDGNWDLFLYDIETGASSRLTATRGDEWDPSPSADGRFLMFAGKFGLLEAIFQMPLPR